MSQDVTIEEPTIEEPTIEELQTQLKELRHDNARLTIQLRSARDGLPIVQLDHIELIEDDAVLVQGQNQSMDGIYKLVRAKQ